MEEKIFYNLQTDKVVSGKRDGKMSETRDWRVYNRMKGALLDETLN